jgi:hypothetical protein
VGFTQSGVRPSSDEFGSLVDLDYDLASGVACFRNAMRFSHVRESEGAIDDRLASPNLPVDRIDRRRLHSHQHFVLPERWFFDLLYVQLLSGAILVYHDCLHARNHSQRNQ